MEEYSNKNAVLTIILTIVAVLVFVFGNKLIKKEDVKYTGVYDVHSTNLSSEYKNYDEIEVVLDDGNEYEYSFDGGEFQKDNTYIVTENKNVSISIKLNDEIFKLDDYEVKNIDTKEPVISYSFPDIYVGDNINVSDYITITDDLSGVKGTNLDSINIDTSSAKEIVFNVIAYDNASNKIEKTIILNVKEKVKEEVKEETNKTQKQVEKQTEQKQTEVKQEEKQEEVKQTYYRYKTKTITTYECDPYDCSYNETSNALSYKYVDTGKCPSDYKTSKATTKTMCFEPVGANNNCIQKRALRYRSFDDDDIILDAEAIRLNVSNCTQDGCKTVYKQDCGTDEISIGGYCHYMCNKKVVVCQDGYTESNGECIKKVSKTCTKTCTKEEWSDFSDWSTTKVDESDDVYVETKYE